MRFTRIGAVATGIALLSVGASCKSPDHGWPGDPSSKHHAAIPHDTTLSAEVMEAWASAATREPGALHTVVGSLVERWAGPGERAFEISVRLTNPEAGHSRKFGTITMATALREQQSDLKQYPCSSCHAGRRVIMREPRITDAHQNIQPVHPAAAGSACSTCHSPDNVAMLALKDGEQASLDHSYRVCAQCHFRQVRDWAGGGHGKRLDGWLGRRVSMSCTDCHDPHKLAVPVRAPLAGTQFENQRKGGKTH